VGASRLFQIATALGVGVNYFFEGMAAPVPANGQPANTDAEPAQTDGTSGITKTDTDILNRRETLELVRSYYRIKDAKQRKIVYDLARSMAEGK
jgi:hypothetical protein